MKFFIFVCLIASQIGKHHVSSFSHHIPQPLSRATGRTASVHTTSSFAPLAFQNVIEKRPQLHVWETATSLRGGAAISIPGLGPVNSFLANNPFAAAFVICAIKATAADVVAQSTEDKTTTSESSSSEDPSAFNMRRTVAFFFYGGAYQGCFQEFLFNGVFPKLFGNGASLLTAIKKASFDMLVVSPLLCLPVAYLIKAVVFGKTFRDGLTKYVHDVKENKLLKKYWMVWTPVQLLTFSIVPEHLRITFIACVSFFWLILLSTISARKITPAKA